MSGRPTHRKPPLGAPITGFLNCKGKKLCQRHPFALVVHIFSSAPPPFPDVHSLSDSKSKKSTKFTKHRYRSRYRNSSDRESSPLPLGSSASPVPPFLPPEASSVPGVSAAAASGGVALLSSSQFCGGDVDSSILPTDVSDVEAERQSEGKIDRIYPYYPPITINQHIIPTSRPSKPLRSTLTFSLSLIHFRRPRRTDILFHRPFRLEARASLLRSFVSRSLRGRNHRSAILAPMS